MDNNQQNAQFNVAPFQRIEIILSAPLIANAPDRSLGEFFPQYEGCGVFIERADFPVQITLVSQSPILSQAFFARDGDMVNAPFKGINIVHPPMQTGSSGGQSADNAKLVILIYKQSGSYQNSYSDPITRLVPPFRLITNTALSLIAGIYIPPGVRLIRKLSVVVPYSTLTANPSWALINSILNNMSGPGVINGQPIGVSPGFNSYGLAAVISGQFRAGNTLVGPSSLFEQDIIPIPQGATEVQVSFTGTGLSSGSFNPVVIFE